MLPLYYFIVAYFDKNLSSVFISFSSLAEANCTRSLDAPLYVALAIVQSYNPRRKVPRSEISMSDLELCLSKAAFSAAKHSGIVPVWFLNIELFKNLKHALEYLNATHLFTNACSCQYVYCFK